VSAKCNRGDAERGTDNILLVAAETHRLTLIGEESILVDSLRVSRPCCVPLSCGAPSSSRQVGPAEPNTMTRAA